MIRMIKYKPEKQLDTLGIDDVVAQFAGKGLSVLEIGCGKNALLVGYLRGKGFNVEGMDPKSKQNTKFLLKQSVTSTHPNPGCIPRKDGTYDLVLSSQNPFLNEGMSPYGKTSYIERLKMCFSPSVWEITDQIAMAIMLESMRVVKKTGAIIVYPAINDVVPRMQEELARGRWKLGYEQVDGVPPEMCTIKCGDVAQDISHSLCYRTVLYKNSINPALARALGL